jgi:hypothetical protein
MTMSCRIICYVVPEGPPRAVAECETHGWMFDNAVAGTLCPIGRIELARDEAIARIREAANDARSVLAAADSDGGAAVAAKPNG